MNTIHIIDIECFSNYFLVGVGKLGQDGSIDYKSYATESSLTVEQIKELKSILSDLTVGYNSYLYDLPVLTKALECHNTKYLRKFSEKVISRINNSSGLDRYSFRKEMVDLYPNHLDLMHLLNFNHRPLKLVGAVLGCRLDNFDCSEPELSESRKDKLVYYNKNDILITAALYNEPKTRKTIEMRKTLGVSTKLSDAEVTTEYFRNYDVKLQRVEDCYEPKKFIFKDKEVLARLSSIEMCKPLLSSLTSFVFDFSLDELSSTGGKREKFQMLLQSNSNAYNFAEGGLHSLQAKEGIEKVFKNGTKKTKYINRGLYVTKDDADIYSVDFASFYPHIMIKYGILKEINTEAHNLYNEIIVRRINAKKSGDKSTADALKIPLNSLYGILEYKSNYSRLSVCLYGQLLLLDLVFILEELGFIILHANTDGLLVAAKKNGSVNDDNLDKVCATYLDKALPLELKKLTNVGVATVSDYFYNCEDGSFVGKGFFDDSVDPSKSLNASIISKAVLSKIVKQDPLIDSVSKCFTIHDFLYVKRSNSGFVLLGNKEDSPNEKVGKVFRGFVSTKSLGGRQICSLRNITAADNTSTEEDKLDKFLFGEFCIFVEDLSDESVVDLKKVNISYYVDKAKKVYDSYNFFMGFPKKLITRTKFDVVATPSIFPKLVPISDATVKGKKEESIESTQSKIINRELYGRFFSKMLLGQGMCKKHLSLNSPKASVVDSDAMEMVEEGIRTGSYEFNLVGVISEGCFVIDVDFKNMESDEHKKAYQELVDLLPLFDKCSIKTPSEGKHIYCKIDGNITKFVNLRGVYKNSPTPFVEFKVAGERIHVAPSVVLSDSESIIKHYELVSDEVNVVEEEQFEKLEKFLGCKILQESEITKESSSDELDYKNYHNMDYTSFTEEDIEKLVQWHPGYANYDSWYKFLMVLIDLERANGKDLTNYMHKYSSRILECPEDYYTEINTNTGNLLKDDNEAIYFAMRNRTMEPSRTIGLGSMIKEANSCKPNKESSLCAKPSEQYTKKRLELKDSLHNSLTERYGYFCQEGSAKGYLDISTGQLLDRVAFNAVERNSIEPVSKDYENSKRKLTASEFFQETMKKENVIVDMVFDPSNDNKVIKTSEGWSVLNRYAYIGKHYEIKEECYSHGGKKLIWIYNTLIGLFTEDPTERDLVRNFLARCYVKKNEKMGHALVLLSKEKGIGKNSLYEAIHACLNNYTNDQRMRINVAVCVDIYSTISNFNAHEKEALLICIDEASVQATAEQRKKIQLKLRTLVTASKCNINDKHEKVKYETVSYFNVLILSNDIRYLDFTEDTRRYLIVESHNDSGSNFKERLNYLLAYDNPYDIKDKNDLFNEFYRLIGMNTSFSSQDESYEAVACLRNELRKHLIENYSKEAFLTKSFNRVKMSLDNDTYNLDSIRDELQAKIDECSYFTNFKIYCTRSIVSKYFLEELISPTLMNMKEVSRKEHLKDIIEKLGFVPLAGSRFEKSVNTVIRTNGSTQVQRLRSPYVRVGAIEEEIKECLANIQEIAKSHKD